jgi:2-polyprenyl-3-methyl-5-hydroxy-6-metoxy-1,4-benzoquinol methylase
MGRARTIMLNATIASTSRNVFLNGEYLRRVPQWHADDSAWKASDILRMLERNDLSPRSIGEVGCGTGEVLRQLQLKMAPGCVFRGYDIAPQAIELSRTRENDRLQCRLGDIRKDPDARFDLLLVLDVLEHQENYFSFLRDVKPLAPF